MSTATQALEMDAKTLAALKGSIAKWEAIVAGTGEENGPSNCPLCKLFWYSANCKGCPVMRRTGEQNCAGTPYEVWDDLQRARERHGFGRAVTAFDTELKEIAAREVEFLRSLLPPGETL